MNTRKKKGQLQRSPDNRRAGAACWHGLAMICVCLAATHGVRADESRAAALSRLSLEELMDVEVTSVSKRPEKLFNSPAAVYVIHDDEIRRSGAFSLPDVLRQVPGLSVARSDSHSWAVSARGFNDFFANKLLVMIDGRSIYTPLFSGVFWDTQEAMLEDLDRIEVIRGPGAALWGANAVNGVINIISKSAKETQGLLVSTGGGTEEQGFVSARYGMKVGDAGWLRVFGQYYHRDDSVLSSGVRANDATDMGRGGFRYDWEPSVQQTFTLQGDLYAGVEHQTFLTGTAAPPFVESLAEDFAVSGGNVLARWSRIFSEDSDTRLQAYYDRSQRHSAIFGEDRDTADFDWQHRLSVGERHEILTGLNYRISHDRLESSFTLAFAPPSRTTQLFGAFVQDQIDLIEDRLRLTLGARLEHNDFTGVEIQPSARLMWTPAKHHIFWGAVSRAVRTPSRVESDVRLNQPGPVPGSIISVSGSTAFESETLIACELGYRAQPASKVTFDVALFYNQYDNLRSSENISVTPGPPVTFSRVLANRAEGQTYGIELGPQIQLLDWWRLEAKYSFLRMDLRLEPGSTDNTTLATSGNSPRQQFTFRSSMDLARNIELDATVRYVDRLTSLGVPGYTSLEARIGWRPSASLEFSLVGQSLLDNQHVEFRPTLIRGQAAEVERSIYGKVTWRF